MKKYTSHTILVALLLICMNLCNAQIAGKHIYRITAFQKGNVKVFSMSNEVAIQPAKVYYMPNAFSPNGDGLNETFGLVGEGIIEYEIQIFNRWGNLVFSSNDLNNRWDGYFNNEAAPSGVYVYKIVGKGHSENGFGVSAIDLTGTVSLVL